MKKLLALLLALTMVFALVGCGGESETAKTPQDDPEKESKYQQAISLISDNDSANDEEAMAAFQELGSYKDAETYLKGFVERPLRMETSSKTVEGVTTRQSTRTNQYDAKGNLLAVTLLQSAPLEHSETTKTSEHVDQVGMYTLVYYDNGDIEGFYTELPGLMLFTVTQDGGKQDVRFGNLFIPAYIGCTLQIEINNSEINLVMVGADAKVGNVSFCENGDCSVTTWFNGNQTGENLRQFVREGNTLQYTEDGKTVLTYEFDASGLLKTIKQGATTYKWEIERGEDGNTLKAVNSAGGAKEETVWYLGQVYAPEA